MAFFEIFLHIFKYVSLLDIKLLEFNFNEISPLFENNKSALANSTL